MLDAQDPAVWRSPVGPASADVSAVLAFLWCAPQPAAMALDVLGHVIQFALGPIALVLHLPELGTVLGDYSQLLQLALGGEVGVALDSLLGGEFAAGTETLASLVGTLVWAAVVASLVGELGLGELGEIGELFELFG